MKKILSLLIVETIFGVSANVIQPYNQEKADNVAYLEKLDFDIDSFVLNEYQKFNKSNETKIIIKDKKYVSSFSETSYVVYEFADKGYAIYDINNLDVIEMSTITKSPYEGYYDNLIYSPLDGYFHKDNTGIYNITQNEYISTETIKPLEFKSDYLKNNSLSAKNNRSFQSKQKALKEKKNSNKPDSGTNSGNQYADVEVNNSWFFRNNTSSFASDHSFHSSGDCGYIALGLLFTYHELFSSKGYFSDEESKAYINSVNGINPNKEHYVPSVNKELIKRLVDCHSTANQTPNALETITNKFMEGKNIKYKVNTPLFYSKNDIKNQIDHDNPVIITGKLNGECGGYRKGEKIWHDVIIYGYYNNSNKYLTHYGWQNCSQIILSDYAFTFVFFLENKNEHIHNNYYKYNGHEYCACGELVK